MRARVTTRSMSPRGLVERINDARPRINEQIVGGGGRAAHELAATASASALGT